MKYVKSKRQLIYSKNEVEILRVLIPELERNGLADIAEEICFIEYRLGKVRIYTKKCGVVIGRNGKGMRIIEACLYQSFGIKRKNIILIKMDDISDYRITSEAR